MNTKEYLSQYIAVSHKIDAMLDEVSQLRNLSTKVTSVMMPDRVQSSRPNNTLSSTVSKIVDMERAVDRDITNLWDVKKKIKNTIGQVKNEQQKNILYNRYILGKTWERIAQDLDLSYQWVCELHTKALRQIKISPPDIN